MTLKILYVATLVGVALSMVGCLARPERHRSSGSSYPAPTASGDDKSAAQGVSVSEGNQGPAPVQVNSGDEKSAEPTAKQVTPTSSVNRAPQIQTSPRFSELTFLTTHNAFVNNGDSSWLAPNQSRSLQFQLENGVTAFMLDLHPYNEGGKDIAAMCHDKCGTIITGPLSIPFHLPVVGVYQKMDLLPYLVTIANFLDKNPKVVLTVFFEDYVSQDQLKAVFDKAPGFTSKIFNPWTYQVKDKGWPRVDQLIKDNKRILVISDHSGKNDIGVVFGPDFTAENYWSMGLLDNDLNIGCKTRWDPTREALNRTDPKFTYLFVMNNFRDVPSLPNAVKDNQIDFLRNRIYKECASVAEKKPNFLAVDHFDEADWGARKMVDEMNDVSVLLYKETDLHGTMQMLRPGKYLTKDLTFGDNQLASIAVYAHTRVKVYEDDNFQKLLTELTEDNKNLGDAAKKASSIEVIRE